MGRNVTVNETDLDSVAQNIIVELAEADSSQSPVEIAERIGEQRQSVWWRLNNSLADAGITTKVDEGQYALTLTGEFYADAIWERLVQPATFNEISEEVLAAREEAESAKESVQRYRQKVYRVKNTAQKASEKVEELEERAATEEKIDHAMTEIENEVLQSLDARIGKLQQTLGDTSRIDDKTIIDALLNIRADVRDSRKLANELCQQNRTLYRNQQDRLADLEEAIEELNAELSAVQQELETSNDGLFDFGR